MRIRVNQYCLEPSAEWSHFKKENSRHIHFVRENPYRRTLGGICLQCGTELFGDWHYSKISSITYNKRIADYSYKEIDAIPFQEKAKGEKLIAHLQEEDSLGGKEESDFGFGATGVTCPICGNKTELRGFARTPDGAVENAYRTLTDFQKFPIRDKIRSFADQTASYVSFPNEGNASFDKSDTASLKTYIGHLIQLETNILSLNKKLTSLYLEQFLNQIEVNRVDYAPMVSAKAFQDELRAQYEAEVTTHNKLLQNLRSVKAAKPAPYHAPELHKPAEPVYLTPGLFNKKSVAEQNALLAEQHRQALLEYESQCQKRIAYMAERDQANQERYLANVEHAEKKLEIHQQELDAIQAKIDNYTLAEPLKVCPEKAKQRMIAEEIAQAEDLLKNTYQARNQLYAADIIFGKYRDLVALATFYEYLMAGRCTSLEGANGAYNLYESEIRANLILSKLSDIEKSLKKIEQSQQMICSQLWEMNHTLARMEDTMSAAYTAIVDIQADTKDMSAYLSQISNNAKVIAHNTAVTAYYSKINAELTNALGFMVALK